MIEETEAEPEIAVEEERVAAEVTILHDEIACAAMAMRERCAKCVLLAPEGARREHLVAAIRALVP